MSDATQVNAIHMDLLVLAVAVGDIVGMPNWASSGLSARVYATGKPLEELTIGELQDILRSQERTHARIEQAMTTKACEHANRIKEKEVAC